MQKAEFDMTAEQLSEVNQKIDEEEMCRDSCRVRKTQRDLEKKRSDFFYTKSVLAQSIMQLEKLRTICDKPKEELINELTNVFNELSDKYKNMYEQWENAYDMWKQNEKGQRVANMKISYIYEIEHYKYKEYNAELQNAFQESMKYEKECMKMDAALKACNNVRRFIFKSIESLGSASV